MIVYLDDGIVAVEGREKALRTSRMVQADLASTGFVTNVAKCTPLGVVHG